VPVDHYGIKFIKIYADNIGTRPGNVEEAEKGRKPLMIFDEVVLEEMGK
jgi:hypothetical protein